MDNTSVTRGDFSLEQQEAPAPPWGGRWFSSATIATDGQKLSPGSELRCSTTVNDGQLDRKKKLFVGMAPKAAYESDYRPVFAPFGNLVDIYVIRDRNGFSKGCAFVKYDSAQSARDAIDALHDKYIMPGGFRTLVVAIADDRRSPSSSSGAISGASAWQSNDNIGGDGCLESCRAIRRRSPRPGGTNNAALCSGGGGCLGAVEYWPHGHISSPPSQQQQQQQITTPQAGFASPAAVPPPSIAPSSTMMPGVPYYFGGVGCGAAPQGTYIYYPHGLPMTSAASSSLSPCQQQMTPGMSKVAGTATANPPRRNVLMTPPCEFDASAAGWHDNFRMAHRPLSSTAMGFPQQQVHHQCDEPRGEQHHHLYGGFFEGSNRGVARMGNPEEEGRRWAKQPVGPSGANLFVYYLPGSLTDADLATAFAPFGEVLSAKVYYDRDTGESKGFGFVSYTEPAHAEAAIARMNGFFIGNKRLKVVRKRGQTAWQDTASGSDGGNSNSVADHGHGASSGCGETSSTGGDSLSGTVDGVDGVDGCGSGGGKATEDFYYHSFFGSSLEQEVFGSQDATVHDDSRSMSPLQYL